ncbi:hypothetical protein BH10BDE1_BH10BDE1_36650 [soil metagenome]
MLESLFPRTDGNFERGRPMSLASDDISKGTSDAKLKTALINSMKPGKISSKTRDLLAASHHRNQAQVWANCFEAPLRAPL